jgi:hypothetical protein
MFEVVSLSADPRVLGDIGDARGHLGASSSLLGSGGIRSDHNHVSGGRIVTSLGFN